MTRRRSPMPDPRLPLRCLAGAVPGLVWLLVAALAAWLYRPVTIAERVERIDAKVRGMEGEHGR